MTSKIDAAASVLISKSAQIKGVAVSDDRRLHAIRFGRKLKALRARAGITQELLAEKADISAIYVRQIEAGIRLPSVAMADALRKGVEATWEELMGE